VFTATHILIAAGLALNVAAIGVVGVALRRAVRRYRTRPAAPTGPARATATAVADLSQEPTMRIPVPLIEPVDPWEGTPPPPAWEAYIAPAETASRRAAAVEPGTGRRVIAARRNAAPAAAEPPITIVQDTVPVRVVEEDGGRWIELVLTPRPKK